MRGILCVGIALLVLAQPLVALVPMADAATAVPVVPPLRPPVPGYPQLSCAIVFEQADSAKCEAEARVGSVTEVNVRNVGSGSVSVQVSNIDGIAKQIAWFTCTSSCTHQIPVSSGTLELYVLAESPRAGAVTVSLESDTFGLP